MGEARRRRLAAQKAGLAAPEYQKPIDGVMLRLEEPISKDYYERIIRAHENYVATTKAERERGNPDAPAHDPDLQEFIVWGLVQTGLEGFEQAFQSVKEASDRLIVTPGEYTASLRRRR